jgi:BirA family biotin operon repressor/biotin-[acetyl-CoA-carboxylase] ligase
VGSFESSYVDYSREIRYNNCRQLACFLNLSAIKVNGIFALFKNSNLLPHQATLLPIGVPFIELPKVDSTNNYAMAQVRKGTASHGTAYFAHKQTSGKGQRGKTWIANERQNLIISIVIEPRNILIRNSFYVSAFVAVSCYDLFKKYAGLETRIKWPNDIYWRDRKAGGILIENVLRNEHWSYAIVGIGLNINQTIFPSTVPNAVSLQQITGVAFNPVDLAKELCTSLERYYHLLQSEPIELLKYYNNYLYGKDQNIKLKKRNLIFETTVKQVTPDGKLNTVDRIEHYFEVGEVEWIL